jgi:hypothetical protein
VCLDLHADNVINTNISDSYVNDEKEKGNQPSAYNLKDLKGFMWVRAHAIRGTKRKPASVETVRNYWNNFTGGWKREHTAIPSDIADSVTAVRPFLSCCNYYEMLTALSKFIYGPLKAEVGLLDEKRPRRYANENHLLLYAEQLWARDWYVSE